MNFILLLNALKKSGEVIKTILAFAFKYWHLVVIAILLFINTQLRNDIVSLNSDKVKLNNDIVLLVQKQQQDLLKVQNKAQEQQIEILTKQKIVEEKYAKQVKKLASDVVTANSANARLSDKISTNANKLSSITKEQADAYTKSLTELSRNCTTRYTEMGAIAQEHRIAEERAVSLYNALVDADSDTNEVK